MNSFFGTTSRSLTRKLIWGLFALTMVVMFAFVFKMKAEAVGLAWERNWSLTNADQIDLVVSDVTASTQVYAISGTIWYKYGPIGNFISSTSAPFAAFPKGIEVVGNNYYLAYDFGSSFNAKKMDSALNTLVNYAYTSSTWTGFGTYDVAVDSSNNVYVTGFGIRSSGSYDWVVVKFNNAGTFQWVYADQTGFADQDVPQNVVAIGNYIYAVGHFYPGGGAGHQMRVMKYSATSTSPVVSFDTRNATSSFSSVSPSGHMCPVLGYNSEPYSLCNIGKIVKISSSTGVMTTIMQASPVGCDWLATGGSAPAFVSPTGIVWTAGACNMSASSITYRTYVSRFNLSNLTSIGPIYIDPFTYTTSWPTGTGGATFAESDNYAYVGGSRGMSAANRDFALWRINALVCNGPLGSVSGPWTQDNPTVSAGVTMKATHINDLRTRINLIRNDAGLSSSTWTDGATLSAGNAIKAQHINELRNSLDAAYTQCAQTTSTPWTDNPIQAGVTPFKAQHINELRTAVINAL